MIILSFLSRHLSLSLTFGYNNVMIRLAFENELCSNHHHSPCFSSVIAVLTICFERFDISFSFFFFLLSTPFIIHSLFILFKYSPGQRTAGDRAGNIQRTVLGGIHVSSVCNELLSK